MDGSRAWERGAPHIMLKIPRGVVHAHAGHTPIAHIPRSHLRNPTTSPRRATRRTCMARASIRVVWSRVLRHGMAVPSPRRRMLLQPYLATSRLFEHAFFRSSVATSRRRRSHTCGGTSFRLVGEALVLLVHASGIVRCEEKLRRRGAGRTACSGMCV